MTNLETSKQDGHAIRAAMEAASTHLNTLQTQRNTTLSSMQAAVDGYFDPLIKAACEELQRKREELLQHSKNIEKSELLQMVGRKVFQDNPINGRRYGVLEVCFLETVFKRSWFRPKVGEVFVRLTDDIKSMSHTTFNSNWQFEDDFRE